MKIPLFNRLKRRIHVEIAMLQDEVVDIVYAIAPKAVLHGGTAIWRCYSGNRFSEDLDFYIPADEGFGQAFLKQLESRGLMVLKYKKTANTIFSKISNGTVEMRFECALRGTKNFEARPYERVDGNFMSIFTLSQEDLLLEKIDAYLGRRLIRDFYDVYLLSLLVAPNKDVREKIGKLLKKDERPIDEKNLRAIVFSGAVPGFEQMLIALKRGFHE